MTFSGSPPHLKDVVVGKNYLNEKELRALGQIVSGYLDFAERQAKHISHDKAFEKASNEYIKYQQKTLSEVEKNYLESLKVIEQKTKK